LVHFFWVVRSTGWVPNLTTNLVFMHVTYISTKIFRNFKESSNKVVSSEV
jgi:hypothetical protein